MGTSSSRRLGFFLWAAAFLLMAGAGAWQRMTGPTYPRRVSYAVGGHESSARLIRSGTTGQGARVELPRGDGRLEGVVRWRRYGTDDDFDTLPMGADGSHWVGVLPSQPAAGKLEYYLELTHGGTPLRVPADGTDNVVMRFKGAVPAWVLIPHIVVMFLSMMIGVRAAMAALLRRPETWRLAWVTLGGLTLGGLLLGPLAQKYAFGEYWTGWPNGYDLTDNKALVMWVVWLLACLVSGWRSRRRARAGRWAIVAAALVMIVVYLIPHSLRGSQLDYNKLDEGVAAEDAIRTG